MTGDQSRLIELAKTVTNFTEQISKCYHDAGLSEPSLSLSSSGVLETPEYDKLRSSLNDAVNELMYLVTGPKKSLRLFGATHFDLAALQVAVEYDFFRAVPLDGLITLKDLAQKTDLDENQVASVMRLLATQNMFVEPQTGVFGHTSYSALMVRDSDIKDCAHMQMDDMFRAASSMADSLRFKPYDNDHNAWTSRFGMTMFEYYRKYPAKATRFARGMEGAARLDRQVSELVDGFDWASLPEGSKVVDCGGGKGHASFVLTQKFPNLYCIVQDISVDMMGSEANNKVHEAERVKFMKHDFFTPQPIHDAAVYFTRQVLHNWDDASVVNILKGYVPALESCRPGTPLLINDTLLPSPGTVSRYNERMVRQLDVAMLLQLGAKQRNVEDIRHLLKQADERYEITRTYDGGSMGLIEVHLAKRAEMDIGQ